MIRTLRAFGALGLGLALAMSVFLWLPEGEKSKTLRPDDASAVSQGKSLYQAHCAECHGNNLEGQPNWRSRDGEEYLPAPPHDATGHTWHHADELLFKMTKEGIASIAGTDYKTQMPVYAETLGDKEIVAVLSYIKSRWPKEIRKRHDRMNQAARRK